MGHRGAMYPELYPEPEGRSRKLRRFALSSAGRLVLMVATQRDNGVEIASFEVQNPQAWEQPLKNRMAKSTS